MPRRKAQKTVAGGTLPNRGPHDLLRFVRAQNTPAGPGFTSVYDTALREILNGRAQADCAWLDVVFPRLQSRSGKKGRMYLCSMEEANAFMKLPILGKRLLETLGAMLLSGAECPITLMGSSENASKARSSIALFARISGRTGIFRKLLTGLFRNVDSQNDAGDDDGDDNGDDNGDDSGDDSGDGAETQNDVDAEDGAHVEEEPQGSDLAQDPNVPEGPDVPQGSSVPQGPSVPKCPNEPEERGIVSVRGARKVKRDGVELLEYQVSRGNSDDDGTWYTASLFAHIPDHVEAYHRDHPDNQWPPGLEIWMGSLLQGGPHLDHPSGDHATTAPPSPDALKRRRPPEGDDNHSESSKRHKPGPANGAG